MPKFGWAPAGDVHGNLMLAARPPMAASRDTGANRVQWSEHKDGPIAAVVLACPGDQRLTIVGKRQLYPNSPVSVSPEPFSLEPIGIRFVPTGELHNHPDILHGG